MSSSLRWSARLVPVLGLVLGSARALVLLLSVVALAGTSLGCAHVCPKVAKDLREFDQAPVSEKGHDLALSLPLARLNKLIAPEVKKLPKFRFKLPKVGKLSLPSMQVVVESLQVRPAPRDQLGFEARVSLRAKNKRVLVINLNGQAPARFDSTSGTLRIAIDETKLSGIKAKVGSGGTKELSAWVWKHIPKQLRRFTPRSAVDAAVDSVTRAAVAGMAKQLTQHAPKLFGELAALELDFQGLPIAAVEVHSNKQFLEVLGRSTLPGSRPLATSRGRKRGVAKNIGQLRLSGAAAAALANQAIEQGEIPERWNREGEADEKGEFKVRVAWADEKRPLKVELFADGKDCAHLRLAATPKLSVAKKGGHIRFASSDAQLEKVVRGDMKVRTAIMFSGVGRKSFTMVEHLASGFELDAGGRTLRIRTTSARADGREVILGFDIARR